MPAESIVPYTHILTTTKTWISQEAKTPFPHRLEILFTPHVSKITIRIHIAFDMQHTSQNLWTAEENTSFCWCVDLADGFENHIPVWTTEIGGGAETGNGVLFCVCVVDHDVGCVVDADFGG
jgi:hypothetical protein